MVAARSFVVFRINRRSVSLVHSISNWYHLANRIISIVIPIPIPPQQKSSYDSRPRFTLPSIYPYPFPFQEDQQTRTEPRHPPTTNMLQSALTSTSRTVTPPIFAGDFVTSRGAYREGRGGAESRRRRKGRCCRWAGWRRREGRREADRKFKKLAGGQRVLGGFLCGCSLSLFETSRTLLRPEARGVYLPQASIYRVGHNYNWVRIKTCME